MSNINLPRVPPAKPPSLVGPRRKLLLLVALVAGALVGGHALSRRIASETQAQPAAAAR